MPSKRKLPKWHIKLLYCQIFVNGYFELNIQLTLGAKVSVWDLRGWYRGVGFRVRGIRRKGESLSSLSANALFVHDLIRRCIVYCLTPNNGNRIGRMPFAPTVDIFNSFMRDD